MASPRIVKRARPDEFHETILSPSSKRPRRSRKLLFAEPTSPLCTAYEHDSKYYFEDGDIILRVSYTLFRVHREKLQSVKGLFQHLFSLPQPDGGVEGIDKIYGIPCCDICLVSPRDIHFMIGFIYDDVFLHVVDEDDRDWYHWDATLALLRVGSKLELPLLRQSAVDVLKVLFPTDLHVCGNQKKIMAPLEGERFYQLYPIEAINISREFDIPSLLPVAYYYAAQLPFADIVNGVTRADGTKEKLCQNDVLRVVQGREELRLSRRHTVFRCLNTFADSGKPSKLSPCCPDEPMRGGDTCFYWLLRMSLDFNCSGFMESRANAMDVLPQKSQEVIKSHLCRSCWDEFHFLMYSGRMKNWEALPSYFGWYDWNDVIEEQEKAEQRWSSED